MLMSLSSVQVPRERCTRGVARRHKQGMYEYSSSTTYTDLVHACMCGGFGTVPYNNPPRGTINLVQLLTIQVNECLSCVSGH